MLQIVNNVLETVKDSFGPVLDTLAWWPEDVASFYYAKLIPIYCPIPLLFGKVFPSHTGARAVKEYSGYIINRRVMHKKATFPIASFLSCFPMCVCYLFIEN